MIRGLFKKGPTTRADVIFAIAGALAAVWKANDVVKTYKHEQTALTYKELEK